MFPAGDVLLYFTDRLFDMTHLFRLQVMSKCGKNKKVVTDALNTF